MGERVGVLFLALHGDMPPTVRYLRGLTGSLDRSRFRLVLGTVRGAGGVQEEAEAAGHRTFCLDCRSRRDYPAAVRRLARLVREERVDVLHGSEELPAFLCGLAGVLAPRCARIYHRHHEYSATYDPATGIKGTTFERARAMASSLNYRVMDLVAGNLADLVLTVSGHHGESVLKERPNWAGKVETAWNGVDASEGRDRDEATAIRQSYGAGSGPVVTVVGRLNHRKGHAVLFDALVRLKARDGLEPIVLVVGSGPLESELRASAAGMGLGRVEFFGSRERVFPWYLAADLAVVPSLVEPFGLVAAEAMACARPVVASGVGGLREIVVDGETGLLVPPKDPESLAGAISSLLSDPSRASAMGARGRVRFESEFTQDAMIRRWEGHYAGALGRSGARRERRVVV